MTALLPTTLVAALIGIAVAGRLEPQYLPPRPFAQAKAYSSAGAFNGAGAYSGANSFAGAPFRFDNNNNGDGTYRYSYEGNGISAHESGSPRAAGSEGAAVTAEGGFSYRAPDGQQISLTYTADENGFHPTGSHLPTPPPIPDAILRSIEFNRRNPSDDGSYRAGAYSSGHNGGYHY